VSSMRPAVKRAGDRQQFGHRPGHRPPLLADGWEVVRLRRGAAGASRTRASSVTVDLTDLQARPRRRRALAAQGASAVVHAAGVLRVGPLGALQPGDGALMWQLHVDAATRWPIGWCRHGAGGQGRVVLVGSRVARGMAGRSQYAATKAALVSLARSWAAEVAPRGVTVNVVSPAATAPPCWTDPARGSVAPRATPMGRLIEPAEVASLVAYLLSPAPRPSPARTSRSAAARRWIVTWPLRTIGIVGLGLVGQALAARLRPPGWRTVGHDVRPEACARSPRTVANRWPPRRTSAGRRHRAARGVRHRRRARGAGRPGGLLARAPSSHGHRLLHRLARAAGSAGRAAGAARGIAGRSAAVRLQPADRRRRGHRAGGRQRSRGVQACTPCSRPSPQRVHVGPPAWAPAPSSPPTSCWA
jgi:3-oxoacyl-[acyl-carrier protein] reductase